ncbi:hypothetical protein Acr_16g0003520 [Actinidia rufa]|uniref:Uncharacterized protein n=1 Tax=Actinidia rufa TaxID=165716 RepID=A0A7J0G0L2_9ERIC|nr:hypothetical protein Acr_16g0003520 [Actinidia rufa]
MAAALWPLVDEIDGAGVAGGGGSTAGATGRGGEDSGGEDVADGGGLEEAVVGTLENNTPEDPSPLISGKSTKFDLITSNHRPGNRKNVAVV